MKVILNETATEMKWAQKWFLLNTNMCCVCVQSVKNVKEKQTSPQKCHPQKYQKRLFVTFPLPPTWNIEKSQHMVGYVCCKWTETTHPCMRIFRVGKRFSRLVDREEGNDKHQPSQSREEDVSFVGSWRRNQDCGNIKQLRGIILGGGGSFRLDISYAFWEKIRQFLPFCYCCWRR